MGDLFLLLLTNFMGRLMYSNVLVLPVSYLQEYNVRFIRETPYMEDLFLLILTNFMGRIMFSNVRVLPVAYLQEYKERFIGETPYLGTLVCRHLN